MYVRHLLEVVGGQRGSNEHLGVWQRRIVVELQNDETIWEIQHC